jgi:hypothetical protein
VEWEQSGWVMFTAGVKAPHSIYVAALQSAATPRGAGPSRSERSGEKNSLKSPKVKVTDNIAGPRVTEEEQCSSRGETDNDCDSDSDSEQTNEQ